MFSKGRDIKMCKSSCFQIVCNELKVEKRYILKKMWEESSWQLKVICIERKLTVTDRSVDEETTTIHWGYPRNVSLELNFGEHYKI